MNSIFMFLLLVGE